jgi:hypothetical protein
VATNQKQFSGGAGLKSEVAELSRRRKHPWAAAFEVREASGAQSVPAVGNCTGGGLVGDCCGADAKIMQTVSTSWLMIGGVVVVLALVFLFVFWRGGD